eukprot:1824532-Pyramimonas_sp.AAC.1
MCGYAVRFSSILSPPSSDALHLRVLPLLRLHHPSLWTPETGTEEWARCHTTDVAASRQRTLMGSRRPASKGQGPPLPKTKRNCCRSSHPSVHPEGPLTLSDGA